MVRLVACTAEKAAGAPELACNGKITRLHPYFGNFPT
jgi:hypothetical protein